MVTLTGSGGFWKGRQGPHRAVGTAGVDPAGGHKGGSVDQRAVDVPVQPRMVQKPAAQQGLFAASCGQEIFHRPQVLAKGQLRYVMKRLAHHSDKGRLAGRDGAGAGGGAIGAETGAARTLQRLGSSGTGK